MDEKLVLLAMEAINDSQKWSQVLAHMMTATGAKAAIITLRDGKTCQIVDDEALLTEYHSPLVCGFSIQAIAHYMQNLRTRDTWADVQCTHYPERPMLMSRVFDPASAPDQSFFEWVNAAGVTDTAVFELERMPGYWTACNLFLGPQSAAEKQAALDYAADNYCFLRKAWQTAQNMVHVEQARHAAFDQLARMSIAACITGPNGEVERSNALFDVLLSEGQVGTCGPKRRLLVPRAAQQHGAASWLASAASDTIEAKEPLDVWATPFSPDPLYRDQRAPSWIVTFGKKRDGVPCPLPLHEVALTAQERRLFDAVRAGATVAQAGEVIGVKRSRAFDIWAEIKQKLGIRNAHQIREQSTVSVAKAS
ncbi:hypothetical protein C8J27_103421 [Rhodobacter aestuarii]|uniref:DNA-binding transcriptional regulator, CsgD family n=1 Tax=Rhodobacter aestuarii TaxID=453582 RepID=A0A1N7JLB0_9RHOB|nr:hypothetical protein [Rhodobacter aestuarii]PTV96088.1 hypothetical protein C8J27_103421 [Rhodobacter aestuarii]SIS50129.1 hypothetical protein SAMN05421580_10214 [Rhodobacter aestuarii]